MLPLSPPGRSPWTFPTSPGGPWQQAHLCGARCWGFCSGRRLSAGDDRACPRTAAHGDLTCPRRSPEPAAFTAKTPKCGLEITDLLSRRLSSGECAAKLSSPELQRLVTRSMRAVWGPPPASSAPRRWHRMTGNTHQHQFTGIGQAADMARHRKACGYPRVPCRLMAMMSGGAFLNHAFAATAETRVLTPGIAWLGDARRSAALRHRVISSPALLGAWESLSERYLARPGRARPA